jgi:4-amino-4-deoxy-L-arabinose transferase-like glycosyltransferase
VRRRQFIAGAASMTAVVLPWAMSAVEAKASYARHLANKTNTFGPDDTLEVRLQKFNELTGMGLTLSEPDGSKWQKVQVCDKQGNFLRVEDQSKWRRFVYPDGHMTGSMDEETMMHWTAQVGFGYRLAKAQG